MARKKIVRSLNDHKIALDKIKEYSYDLIAIKTMFYGGGEAKSIVTGEELEEWYSKISSYIWNSNKYYTIYDEVHFNESAYTKDPSLIEIFIEKLYGLTLELINKIRKLKKIVKSFSLVKSIILNSDRRKMIQRMKHNFRHFDDEENNELKVARKQFYNSNFIKTSWKNLEINLMKYFPSQILTMN